MAGILPTIARMKAGKAVVNPNYNPDDPNSMPFAKEGIGFLAARLGLEGNSPADEANIRYKMLQLQNAMAKKAAENEWKRREQLAEKEAANARDLEERRSINQQARDKQESINRQIEASNNREAIEGYNRAERLRAADELPYKAQQEAIKYQMDVDKPYREMEAKANFVARTLGQPLAKIVGAGSNAQLTGNWVEGNQALEQLNRGYDVSGANMPKPFAVGNKTFLGFPQGTLKQMTDPSLGMDEAGKPVMMPGGLKSIYTPPPAAPTPAEAEAAAKAIEEDRLRMAEIKRQRAINDTKQPIVKQTQISSTLPSGPLFTAKETLGNIINALPFSRAGETTSELSKTLGTNVKNIKRVARDLYYGEDPNNPYNLTPEEQQRSYAKDWWNMVKGTFGR